MIQKYTNHRTFELKISAIVEAWEVTDKLDDGLEKAGMWLVSAVANPASRENEFLRPLEVIKEVGVNEHIVAQVCASFLANREPDKTKTVPAVIKAFIEANKVEDTFALLHRVAIQPSKRPLHQIFNPANLRDSHPLDPPLLLSAPTQPK